MSLDASRPSSLDHPSVARPSPPSAPDRLHLSTALGLLAASAIALGVVAGLLEQSPVPGVGCVARSCSPTPSARAELWAYLAGPTWLALTASLVLATVMPLLDALRRARPATRKLAGQVTATLVALAALAGFGGVLTLLDSAASSDFLAEVGFLLAAALAVPTIVVGVLALLIVQGLSETETPRRAATSRAAACLVWALILGGLGSATFTTLVGWLV